MNRHVNAIAERLSLRPPQRKSLELLDRVTEIAPPKRGADVTAALESAPRSWRGQFLRAGAEPDDLQQADRGFHTEYAQAAASSAACTRCRNSAPIRSASSRQFSNAMRCAGSGLPKASNEMEDSAYGDRGQHDAQGVDAAVRIMTSPSRSVRAGCPRRGGGRRRWSASRRSG